MVYPAEGLVESDLEESFYMDGVRFGGGGSGGGEKCSDDAGASQPVHDTKRPLPQGDEIAGPPKRRAAAVKACVALRESLHPPKLPRERPRGKPSLRDTKTVQYAAVDVSALCKALPRGRCNNCPPCLTAVVGKRRCVRSAARELGFPGALLTCMGHAAVGMLVAVAWPEDDTSYEAVVTAYDDFTMRHEITYCIDGVVETLKLWKTELNILCRCDGGEEDAAPADGDVSDGPGPKDRTPAPKLPPTVKVTVLETPDKGESPEAEGLLVVDCSDSDNEEETTRRIVADAAPAGQI